jgi:hypothetical protein
MTREELKAYHVEAAAKLRSYADDSGLRESDVKHYTKRAAFHDECVAVIDTLLTPLEPVCIYWDAKTQNCTDTPSEPTAGIVLPDEQFDQVTELLEANPLATNLSAQRLLRSKRPWSGS